MSFAMTCCHRRHRFSIRLLGEFHAEQICLSLQLELNRDFYAVLETRIYLHRASFIRAIQEVSPSPMRVSCRLC